MDERPAGVELSFKKDNWFDRGFSVDIPRDFINGLTQGHGVKDPEDPVLRGVKEKAIAYSVDKTEDFSTATELQSESGMTGQELAALFGDVCILTPMRLSPLGTGNYLTLIGHSREVMGPAQIIDPVEARILTLTTSKMIYTATLTDYEGDAQEVEYGWEDLVIETHFVHDSVNAAVVDSGGKIILISINALVECLNYFRLN